MGLASSSSGSIEGWENPVDKVDATLYYFSGRGVADQMRWMLAATEVSFTQKVISHRDQLAKMARQQLPFGQLPLLQIDGIEIVQSQAAVRYLARRAKLEGRTAEETLKCDMIAETVRDLLSLLTAAPFKRCAGLTWRSVHGAPPTLDEQVVSSQAPENTPTVITGTDIGSDNNNSNTNSSNSSSEKGKPDVRTPLSRAELENPEWLAHQQAMKEKWAFVGGRFEAILRSNARKTHASAQTQTQTQSSQAETHSALYLVGEGLTYADILVAHVTTWFVEECGPEVVKDMPLLVNLQRTVVSLPGIKNYFKSINYFPIGNIAYVEQVRKVLNKNL